jgi:hypothetical protein
MKKHLILSLALGFILSLVMVSCKKHTDNTPPSIPYKPLTSTSLAGLGQHIGTPVGTTFALPSFIKMVGHLYGGVPGKSSIMYPKTEAGLKALLGASSEKTSYTDYGYGTYVNIYTTLVNTSSSSYKLIIPAGLLMCDSIPANDTVQGGVIITDDTIPIGGGDTVNLCLKSFCVNLQHHIPSYTHHYGFTCVTTNDQLSRVVTILRNKKTLVDHTGEIQSILWTITDGSGLTESDVATMNSWQ